MAQGENVSVVPDAEILERWDGGERAADIARHYGITRQRVDQRLKRNGRVGPNRNALPEPEAIVAAAKTVFAMDELAVALGQTSNAIELAITKHDLRDKIVNLLQGNRRARAVQQRLVSQQDYVRRLRAIAIEVGHTQKIAELEARDIYHAKLAQLFGSAPSAMLAAGLIPNQAGNPSADLPPDFGDDEMPTLEREALTEPANRLLLAGEFTVPPDGNKTPERRVLSTNAFYRDPKIVAWVRRRSEGICEACGTPGYECDTGVLFLEVHHLVPLSEGGPDVIENAVAACETCHGKLHRWIDRSQMAAVLLAKAKLSISGAP